MPMLITDPVLQEQLLAQRRTWGGDHHDELWEGVYVMAPLPNNEHQELVLRISRILYDVVETTESGQVYPGVNVSDRLEDWEHNYRCPDIVVFLKSSAAVNHGTHWTGGPDLVIEIVSPHDLVRDKLGFYGSVGTRELIIVDRAPWQLERYQLEDGQLVLAGTSHIEQPDWLVSKTVPLNWRLQPGDARPRIELQAATGDKTWDI